MPLADTIGAATVAFPHYAPGTEFLEQLVGSIETPCDYSDRKWGFSHGAAQWVGFVKACATCHTGAFCADCHRQAARSDPGGADPAILRAALRLG